jgi:hypothetical protein
MANDKKQPIRRESYRHGDLPPLYRLDRLLSILCRDGFDAFEKIERQGWPRAPNRGCVFAD